MSRDGGSTNDNFPSFNQPPTIINEVVEMKPRKNSSKAWQHATKIRKINNVTKEVVSTVARCNYCGFEAAAHSKGHGNNGIADHVERCIKNPANMKSKSSSQPSVTGTSENNPSGTHIFSQKLLAAATLEFVIMDEHPFKVVEKRGFVRLMNQAVPQFKIPNRRKIASGVWDLFKSHALEIKKAFAGQRLSITTDTWTSVQNINYMVITAHFLDNDWKLHKRIINFTKITSHKGDDIGKVLETCLNNWGIDKVFTITVDNASSNDKAVEYMAKRLEELGTLLLGGKYLHLRCTCHVINLIVKSGLKFLNQSIEAIRNCVKYLHSSGARLDKFREYAILMKMDKMSTVPMDVPTRWNATYTMLSAAFKFKKVFGRMEENVHFIEYFDEMVGVGRDRKKRSGPPVESDWVKAEIFMNFLKRFYDSTLRLSGSKTSTSPLIWQQIFAIRRQINSKLDDTADFCLQEIATKMDDKFNKYYGDLDKVNKLMFICNILDPRFKLQVIEMNLKDMKWHTDAITTFVDGLKCCLNELYEEYKGNSSMIHVQRHDDMAESSECLEAFMDDPDTMEYLLQLDKFRKLESQAEITNEVDKYFHDPYVKLVNPDFNLLEWWKVNTSIYPILSKVAKDVFAIPSSTVASENAFSLGRRVVDPFRASLHPNMVEALVCTNDWLRADAFNLYQEPTDDELNFYKECESITGTVINP